MNAFLLAAQIFYVRAEPLRVGSAYRDGKGNLIATYKRPDYGPDGLMYCRPTECNDLVSTESAFSNRDQVLDFKINGEKDHAEVRLNSTSGRFKLTCPPDRVVDLQPVSESEARALQKKIESGQLKRVASASVQKPVFLFRVNGSNEMIYQVAQESEVKQIYVGTPGRMVKIKSEAPDPHNRCNFKNGCRDQYFTDVGGSSISNGKFLDVSAKTWGRETLEPVDLASFDLASLKIPGQPPTKSYNLINPCSPDGATVDPSSPPAPAPTAR